MDPMTHYLAESPRSRDQDAFFKIDRSTETVVRTVDAIPYSAKGVGRRAPVSFQGFKTRHDLRRIAADNPLPHARKTAGKDGVIDTSVAGHASEAIYTCFLSAEARKLLGPSPPAKRLRVVILWGTGTQCLRQGVAGAVENAERPTLLINVSGVETNTEVTFTPPGDPLRSRTLVSNNSWAVGCTNALVEDAIRRFFPRLIDYAIDTLAAYSTGHSGLQESVNRGLIRIDDIERVVIFDCLYGSLRAPLSRLQALRPGLQIVSYVSTGGGNSFVNPKLPTMRTLILKDMPGWHYIDLLYDKRWHAIAAAHILNEGRRGPYPIIDALPTRHLDALDALTAVLPERLTVVSDEKVFAKVRGTIPPGVVGYRPFSGTPEHMKVISDFHDQVAVTQQCLQCAQLLGWQTPPGEEWHDMVLAEFGWEYLA